MVDNYVGGLIFSRIKSDERVTSDLNYCLYCKVSHNEDGKHLDINYNIPLDCISGSAIKQCPACKTFYILSEQIANSCLIKS